jgi:hypothetical protein
MYFDSGFRCFYGYSSISLLYDIPGPKEMVAVWDFNCSWINMTYCVPTVRVERHVSEGLSGKHS